MKPPANWEEIRNCDTAAATKTRQAQADAFALRIARIINDEVSKSLLNRGLKFNSNQIAQYLNEENEPPPRGGKWSRTQVKRLFDRLEKIHSRNS